MEGARPEASSEKKKNAKSTLNELLGSLEYPTVESNPFISAVCPLGGTLGLCGEGEGAGNKAGGERKAAERALGLLSLLKSLGNDPQGLELRLSEEDWELWDRKSGARRRVSGLDEDLSYLGFDLVRLAQERGKWSEVPVPRAREAPERAGGEARVRGPGEDRRSGETRNSEVPRVPEVPEVPEVPGVPGALEAPEAPRGPVETEEEGDPSGAPDVPPPGEVLRTLGAEAVGEVDRERDLTAVRSTLREISCTSEALGRGQKEGSSSPSETQSVNG